MQDLSAIFSFEVITSIIFTFTFELLSILVLRKSRSKINYLFAIGSSIFGLGTFFAGLGYLFPEQQILLWSIGTALLVLSPVGYFLSSRRIITGLSLSNEKYSMIMILVFGIFGIFVLVLYPTLNNDQNIIIWDLIIALGLFLCATQFFTVLRISPPDLKKKIILLIFGLVIASLALITNVLLTLFNPSGSSVIIRYGISLLGNLLVVTSFIRVPNSNKSES